MKRYALFGDPVAHSMSPLMMNAAFRVMDISARYQAVRVSEASDIIRLMRSLHIEGASVTIPHKVSVIEFLDEISESAHEIGAVNTVIEKSGRLRGENTDWIGVKRALEESSAPIERMRCAVVGAGGASRAAIYAVRKNGGKAIVLNRTRERGERLARQMGCEYASLNDIASVDADCLINATPLGMWPDTGSSPVDRSMVYRFTLVMDTIYNPLMTKLLTDAEYAGVQIISGLSMFVHQGAEQLRIWTGKEPPVDLMRKKVREHLENERN